MAIVSPTGRPHPNPLLKEEGTEQARTRAALQEVLARREFADLHADPYAFWRKVVEWIGRTFSTIGRLPGWLLWIIVAWLVAALLAILAHLIYTLWRILGSSVRSSSSRSSLRHHRGALLGIQELDFDVVYAEAQRRLAASDWLAAAKHLYVAAILWLDRQGWVTFRAAKTDRDYLTQLAAQPRLQESLGRLTRDFETIVYGGQPATMSVTHNMANTVEGLLHETARITAS